MYTGVESKIKPKPRRVQYGTNKENESCDKFNFHSEIDFVQQKKILQNPNRKVIENKEKTNHLVPVMVLKSSKWRWWKVKCNLFFKICCKIEWRQNQRIHKIELKKKFFLKKMPDEQQWFRRSQSKIIKSVDQESQQWTTAIRSTIKTRKHTTYCNLCEI